MQLNVGWKDGSVFAAVIRGANLVDHVTNAELVAAFGADIVNIDTYDPFNPSHSWLVSLNIPSMDENPAKCTDFFWARDTLPGNQRDRRTNRFYFDVRVNPEDVERTEQVYGKGIVATAQRIIDARRLGVKHICISGAGLVWNLLLSVRCGAGN